MIRVKNKVFNENYFIIQRKGENIMNIIKKMTLSKEVKNLETQIEGLVDIINQNTEVEKNEDDVSLNSIIDGVLIELSVERPENEDFMKIANSLEKLYKVKNMNNEKVDKLAKIIDQYEKVRNDEKNQKQFPWKEFAVGIFGIIQILLIINHETVGVFTSKAVGFVTRLRA